MWVALGLLLALFLQPLRSSLAPEQTATECPTQCLALTTPEIWTTNYITNVWQVNKINVGILLYPATLQGQHAGV